MCFHTKPIPPAPIQPVSVAVQPVPAPPIVTTDSVSSVAHVRFASTEQVDMRTALRGSPSTIYSIKEEKKE
jgi:hypothetical protein